MRRISTNIIFLLIALILSLTGCGGGGGGDGAGGAPPPGSGGAMTSLQIQAVRLAADGVTNLPVNNVIVTYIVPAIGNDPAGFTVQAEASGPALFVAVDPTTLAPVPAAGDVVSFSITGKSTAAGMARATSITAYSRAATGASLSSLVQDVSAAADLIAALDNYDTELVRFAGTVDEPFGAAGTGFVSVLLTNAAFPPGGSAVHLRLPTTLRDSLELATGCNVHIEATPLWRSNANAQVSAWAAGEFVSTTCPAPRLLSAYAASATSALLVFDRNIKPTSVLGNGSQFAFDSRLSATGASIVGKAVTVSTSAQSADTYTVTAASTVTDNLDAGIDGANNSRAFTGYGGSCGSPVVISQIYGAGGLTGAPYLNDFIELHNRSTAAINISTWSVQYASASGTTWFTTNLAGTIPAGGFVLVQGASSGVNGSALPTPDVSGTLNLSSTSGKVALVANQTALSGTCPGAGVADLVGYGTANCSESAAAGTISATTANIRRSGRCMDTGSNLADFTVEAPAPRNNASAAISCGCTAQ